MIEREHNRFRNPLYQVKAFNLKTKQTVPIKKASLPSGEGRKLHALILGGEADLPGGQSRNP